jgi:predicted permease
MMQRSLRGGASRRGFVGVRRLHLEARTLSATAFYIFTPCLVFTSLLHIQLDLSEVGQIATLNLCMTVLLMTLGYVLSMVQQRDR